jgi:hypothetical protein
VSFPPSWPLITILLTIFGVCVLIYTRLSRVHYGTATWVHTGFGVVALVLWGLFLLIPNQLGNAAALIGVLGLGAWWVVVGAGLYLFWMIRSRGSAIAHLGLLLAALTWTWAYSTASI